MRTITHKMLEIYVPYSGMDWLNYKIVRRDMTAHHIVKREDGGKLILSNIAPLMYIGHEYLHIIECKDIEAYITLNRILKMINQQEHEPTEGQRQMIEYILREFESIHKEDMNAKGKPIIREAYKKRMYHL